MRIKIICEGKTEKAFEPCLREFLKTRLSGQMPRLKFDVHNGAIPTKDKLKRVVKNSLAPGKQQFDAVIGLVDVYPDFKDADQAKKKMREWVGPVPDFYPHVALHDFEAWLLPYWNRVKELARREAASFSPNPETVNHGDPPAHRLKAMFRAGTCRDSYNKPRDAGRILKDADLMVAINACPELKKFVNTILKLCDETKVLS